MNIKIKYNFKKNVVNFFGAFGYIFCSLQWLWTAALNFSLIMAFVTLISPSPSNHVVKSTESLSSGSNPLVIIISIAVTITMALITMYIIIKIPSTIVKTTKKALHNTAENVTPLVLRIQHKKDTKKNHISLTPRLVLIFKIILITAPLILSFTSKFVDKQIFDFYIAMFISLWLACASIAFFAFQYFLTVTLSIKRQDLW